MLLYSLGDEGDQDLYRTFKFADEDNVQYSLKRVIQSFDIFQCKIQHSAKFLKRRQGLEETEDSSRNELHGLAETCEFDELNEEFIRDLIVIVYCSKLSQSLEMDESLTEQNF